MIMVLTFENTSLDFYATAIHAIVYLFPYYEHNLPLMSAIVRGNLYLSRNIIYVPWFVKFRDNVSITKSETMYQSQVKIIRPLKPCRKAENSLSTIGPTAGIPCEVLQNRNHTE